jgi:TP901 family phage tail tape measure protein
MATTYEIAVKIAGKLESTFSQSFMSAASILQKHQDKITGVKKSLKELEEAHKQGKISAEEYAASYTKLTAELEKAKAAQEGLAKAVNFQRSMEEKASAARGKLLRSTTLMTAALAGPVVAAMNFESAMADVRKVVDFETPQQFKEMGEDILSLTRRIPMTARDLADIVAAAGQAGIARNELLAFAESAAKMGVAFDITAEQAGQMMAQWRTAFKMSQKQVVELADQINYLGNTTAASAPKISDIVTKIGPLGEIGGVAAREIVALGATIGSVGIQEEVAATGIKNLILRLNSGASATDRQKKAFKSLGLSATKLAKAMQEDASGAILSVIEALGKIPEYKRTAILTDLFGRESVAAIAPLITNIDKLRENLRKVGDATQYQGSMEKEFKERSETTANAIRILANNINILSVNLGSFLLPPLAATAKRLSAVSDKIAKWTKAHPQLTKVLVLGTAGLLAFRVAMAAAEFAIFSTISKLAKLYVFLVQHDAAAKIATISTKAFSLAQRGLKAAITLTSSALHALPIVAYQAKVIAVAAATKLWTAAQVAFNLAVKLGSSLLSVAKLIAYTVAVKGIAIATKVWTAAQWLLNAALSANPIGLLIIAIAGLVAGFVLLYKKSETVRNIVSRLWDVIGIGPRVVAAAIGKVRDFAAVLGKIKIPNIFGAVWGGITGMAKTAAGKIGSIFGGFKMPNLSLMPKIVWNIAEFPFEAISAVTEKISGIMGKIRLPDIWESFKSTAINAIGSIEEKLSAFMSSLASLGNIYDVLTSGAASAYSFVTDKLNALVSFVGSITWPQSLGDIWNIITSGASSVFQAVTNALNWVIDKVNWFIDKLNKIKLPSWLPIVGGKGVNIQMIEQIKAPAAAPAPVPGHAEGGVFSTPHVAMVAEKGPEAILPLDRLLDAIRESRTGITAPPINITYSPASPVINIYERGGVNPEQIRSEVLRAERKVQEEFEARLKAFLAQQGRLSYA